MSYRFERYLATRYWAVLDPAGELVAVVLYRRAAAEIVRRLSAHQPEGRLP